MNLKIRLHISDTMLSEIKLRTAIKLKKKKKNADYNNC